MGKSPFRAGLAIIVLWGVCGAGTLQGASGIQTDQHHDSAVQEILIRYKKHVNRDQQLAIASRLRAQPRKRYERFNIQRLRIAETETSPSMEAVAAQIRANPDVEWAEPNYRRTPQRVPNDPLLSSQWYLQDTTGQEGSASAGINALRAWTFATGTPEVVVAVLDSGIDYSHPDLQANMWRNSGEDWTGEGRPGNNGLDDDLNGYVDDYYGIDAVNDDGDPMDGVGHGTHIAGLIGAVGNNGQGIAGVLWQTRLMALKFLDPYGTVGDEIECIDYILDQLERGVPVRVVNASFSDALASRFEREAIQALADAGIVVAAAAGSTGAPVSSVNQDFPSCYDLENIISVTATGKDGRLAPFANYGFYETDIAAPGVDILSTHLNHGYATLQGTSMATALVAGTLAMLYGNRDMSLQEARERILRGVEPDDALSGRVFSGGRLNVYKTLTLDLQGPFIFGVSPIQGSPGTEITITGVRFGKGDLPASRVTLGGESLAIVHWQDERIDFLLPAGGTTSESLMLQVHTADGSSNAVPLNIARFRYVLPFVPVEPPWSAFLIVTNYHETTVAAQVFAGPSDAWEIDPQLETLNPWQILIRNIRDYGLRGEKNILWVESEKALGIQLFYFNTDQNTMTLAPACQR